MIDIICIIIGIIAIIAGITVPISALISYKVFEKRINTTIRLYKNLSRKNAPYTTEM